MEGMIETIYYSSLFGYSGNYDVDPVRRLGNAKTMADCGDIECLYSYNGFLTEC